MVEWEVGIETELVYRPAGNVQAVVIHFSCVYPTTTALSSVHHPPNQTLP